jgi:hypothetical protein
MSNTITVPLVVLFLLISEKPHEDANRLTKAPHQFEGIWFG